MTTVNGGHCRCRRWLTVTVCEVVTMENMFRFHNQQSSNNVCPRACANPYVKCTTSSSSLLTRKEDDADVLAPHFQRLHHTCSGKTLFLCKFLQRHGIVAVHCSQLRSLQYYSREIRKKAIITQMCYAGPGSASLGMSPPSTRLRLRLDWRMSTYCTEVAQATPTGCFRELMSTIPLSCLSICHTNTCQTVTYTCLVNLWYSPGE